jgi:hypothetical protein
MDVRRLSKSHAAASEGATAVPACTGRTRSGRGAACNRNSKAEQPVCRTEATGICNRKCRTGRLIRCPPPFVVAAQQILAARWPHPRRRTPVLVVAATKTKTATNKKAKQQRNRPQHEAKQNQSRCLSGKSRHFINRDTPLNSFHLSYLWPFPGYPPTRTGDVFAQKQAGKGGIFSILKHCITMIYAIFLPFRRLFVIYEGNPMKTNHLYRSLTRRANYLKRGIFKSIT